jgi:hypothetical protein
VTAGNRSGLVDVTAAPRGARRGDREDRASPHPTPIGSDESSTEDRRRASDGHCPRSNSAWPDFIY